MFDRDRILEAVDLAELADELLGPRRGTARSGTWPCPEPTHAQTGRTPPLSVFRTRSGQQRWRCHGCGAGGTAVDLVMATQGGDVRAALEALAARTGAVDQAPAPPFRPRPRPTPPDPEPSPVALAALSRYVARCARRLWLAEGTSVRRWLTEERGLPAPVLRANLVGADPGPGRPRPVGVPRAGGAVLPVLADGRVVFAQLRRIRVRGDQHPYLNVAADLAPNPRLAPYRPAAPATGRATLVTEGAIDALSAAAAGFPAVAVLGAGVVADERIAERLARMPGPLVVAFDADPAGQAAAAHLCDQLRGRGCAPARLHVPAAAGDLNAWMVASPDWAATLTRAVRAAVRASAMPPASLART